MVNFHFLDKGLGIVYPAHFLYDQEQKCSSCYILLTIFYIVWLPLLLEILGNICITIVC